jgi:hypothetical protein
MEKKKEQTAEEIAGVKVVGGEIKNGKLFVTIEGATPDTVHSLRAKNAAYEARFKYGFAQAGMETAGAPWPVDEKGNPYTSSKTKPAAFRALFRFTPTL